VLALNNLPFISQSDHLPITGRVLVLSEFKVMSGLEKHHQSLFA
jgi:hypothetical protein